MRKRFVILPIVAMAATIFGGIAAQGHSCPEGYENQQDPECEETHTVPNWRAGNYVPLFDLENRDDPDQRRDAQRWQEECDNWQPGQGGYQSRQMCFWMYGGVSLFPNRGEDRTDPNSYSPNEWHVGFAATHCFLFEFAHQCEDHFEPGEEGTHDAHGGAIYADICLTENPESKYCDEGLKDTQVGVTIMDHNPCGLIIPIVACTDEYHVIRPFDPEFTQHQMEDSATYIQQIAEDPMLYLMGCPRDEDGNRVCPPHDHGDDPESPAVWPMVGSSGTQAGAGVPVAIKAQIEAMRALGAAGPAGMSGPAGSSGVSSSTATSPLASTSTASSLALLALVLAAFVARATRRLVLR